MPVTYKSSDNPDWDERQGLTKEEYVDRLFELYVEANYSDSTISAPWMPKDAATTHCCAIEGMLHSLMTDDEYEHEFNRRF